MITGLKKIDKTLNKLSKLLKQGSATATLPIYNVLLSLISITIRLEVHF